MTNKPQEIRKILGIAPDCDLAEVVITPAMARELIKYNTNNRTRSKEYEKEYAADMREGKFVMAETMVGFNRKGEMTNGQGRLYACIDANKKFTTVVCMKLEQNIHMDKGRSRKTADNIKLAGALKGICNDSSSSVMTVKALLRTSRSSARVRDEEVVDFCKKHAKIIDKTYELGLLNIKGGKRAVFKVEIAAALLAAAINNVDLNKLVHIRNILTEGMSVDSSDKIILNYRDKAFELYGNNSGSVRKQLYFGAQHVIYVYDNKMRTTSVKMDSEYYHVF